MNTASNSKFCRFWKRTACVKKVPKRRISRDFGMKALEQFVEEIAGEAQGNSSEEAELLIDNPFLNFQNSEVYFEKKKDGLREKIKQSANALEHYLSMETELKMKRTELSLKIANECLTSLGYPREIKWPHQTLRLQYFPEPQNHARL